VVRGSRSQPKWVLHALVGKRDPDSGYMELTSFKPDDPEDVPWWRVLQRRSFKGSLQKSD
jgi:hypothetical protein